MIVRFHIQVGRLNLETTAIGDKAEVVVSTLKQRTIAVMDGLVGELNTAIDGRGCQPRLSLVAVKRDSPLDFARRVVAKHNQLYQTEDPTPESCESFIKDWAVPHNYAEILGS